LGAIYWRDNSILARWNSGKYTKFQIDGVLQDMDENVMVTSEREPNRIGFDSVTGYSWMRCDDNTRKKHEIKKNTTDYNMRQKACIVDSKGADPIIANVSGSTLYLCVGPNIVSTHTLPYQLVKDILCCNYKLFIDQYVYTLDDRGSFVRLFTDNTSILDVNPLNDMYISNTGDSFSRYLWSAKHEMIGEISDCHKYATTMKFLDDYRIAGAYDLTVEVFDIRKLNGTALASISAPYSVTSVIDPANQRFIQFRTKLSKIANLLTQTRAVGLEDFTWKTRPHFIFTALEI
jgi:hypothetical protein